MTERVRRMLSLLKSGEYKKMRNYNEAVCIDEKIDDFAFAESIQLCESLAAEQPFFLDGDIFGFNRYNAKPASVSRLSVAYGNVTPNYARIINRGFDDVLGEIEQLSRKNPQSSKLYEAIRMDIAAVLDISDRYREAAIKAGNTRVAEALSRIPRKKAQSFYDACLLLVYNKQNIFCQNICTPAKTICQ